MIGVVEGELMSIVDELLSSGCGGGERMHLHKKFGAVDLRQVRVPVYETTCSFTRNPRIGYALYMYRYSKV